MSDGITVYVPGGPSYVPHHLQEITPHVHEVGVSKAELIAKVSSIDIQGIVNETMANLGWGDGDPVFIAVARMKEVVLGCIESS